MLELKAHPARSMNPVTGKKDLITLPDDRQIMQDGSRIGFVRIKPPIRVHLLVHMQDEQKKAVVDWVTDQLGEPKSVGMVPDPKDLPDEVFFDDLDTE